LDGNNVVKLGNFDMLRPLREEMYTARRGWKFPIKWTAPEALEFNEFTDKSDVWGKNKFICFVLLCHVLFKQAPCRNEYSSQ
jgi:hypothetical protein